MIKDSEEYSESSMKKLNQMDIKDIFNFMDNFLLDQDISSHVDKEFLQDASTHYEVKYNKNKAAIGLILTLFFCLLTAVLNIEFPKIEVIPYIGSALVWCSLALFLYGSKEAEENNSN